VLLVPLLVIVLARAGVVVIEGGPVPLFQPPPRALALRYVLLESAEHAHASLGSFGCPSRVRHPSAH